MTDRSEIADARRWVVKVGSALLTDDGRGLDTTAFDRIAEVGFELPADVAGHAGPFGAQHHGDAVAVAEADGRIGVVFEHRDVHQIDLVALLGEPARNGLHVLPGSPPAQL